MLEVNQYLYKVTLTDKTNKDCTFHLEFPDHFQILHSGTWAELQYPLESPMKKCLINLAGFITITHGWKDAGKTS